MNFVDITNALQELAVWASAHALWLGLAIFVFIQWLAFQGLLVHYHFFRESLRRPRPDLQRISTLEKTLEFQMSQMDTMFQKMAELKKELNDRARREDPILTPESLESRFMSLGEMKLKQRLSEIKAKLQ